MKPPARTGCQNALAIWANRRAHFGWIKSLNAHENSPYKRSRPITSTADHIHSLVETRARRLRIRCHIHPQVTMVALRHHPIFDAIAVLIANSGLRPALHLAPLVFLLSNTKHHGTIKQDTDPK